MGAQQCMLNVSEDRSDAVSYQTVNEKELEDVQQHPAQWDLQGPQVGVGSEEGDESQRAEDVGNGKQRLCDQGRVPHLPLLPRPGGVILQEKAYISRYSLVRPSRLGLNKFTSRCLVNSLIYKRWQLFYRAVAPIAELLFFLVKSVAQCSTAGAKRNWKMHWNTIEATMLLAFKCVKVSLLHIKPYSIFCSVAIFRLQ